MSIIKVMIYKRTRISIPLEEQKANRKFRAKMLRDHLKTISPEQKEDAKQRRYYAKLDRQRLRQEKTELKEQKILNKRELAILEFMKRTDVIDHHHGLEESIKAEIVEQISFIKGGENWDVYHPYIWNHYGEGNNKIPRSLLGRLWRSNKFQTIYNVPLDGTCQFYCYDSGERGLGSFDRISAFEVEIKPIVPKVEPGSFPPIIAH